MTTPYGEALLARGRAAFDELRQGIREIEFIADPDAGELRIGCPESIAAGFLVRVLERFSREHPRVRFHVQPVFQPTVEFPELLERKIDHRAAGLGAARLPQTPFPQGIADRIVDTSPRRSSDLEEQDARSNRPAIPRMCPRARCKESLVGKLGNLHRSRSATSTDPRWQAGVAPDGTGLGETRSRAVVEPFIFSLFVKSCG